MTQGNGTPMDIDPVPVNSKGLNDGKSCCREGLVDFEKIDSLQRQAGFLEHLRDRIDRRDEDIL
jgi:hypothetical protein